MASRAPFAGPSPDANQTWPPPWTVTSVTAEPLRQPDHVSVVTGPATLAGDGGGQPFCSAQRRAISGVAVYGGAPAASGAEGWPPV